MDLFGQQWRLQIGALDVSDHDIAFSVSRSTRAAPNVAEIRVWNLSPSDRATVEAGGTAILRAGFEDPPVIFQGDSRLVWTERDAVDAITVIQARDGGRAYADARIARAYRPGTPVLTVLRDAVEALDIGEGNLSEYSSALSLRGGATSFADGYAADGPARRVVDALTRAAGLRWSVQGGALQLMDRGRPLQSRAVLLSSDTGMVDHPTWTDQRRRRLLTIKSLIQPGLDPGRRVAVVAPDVEGDFEVRAIEYVGDTRGDDWYATIQGRPVG